MSRRPPKRISAQQATRLILELDTDDEDIDDIANSEEEVIDHPDTEIETTYEITEDEPIDTEIPAPSHREEISSEYVGKSGRVWSKTPPPPSRTRAENIFRGRSGPTVTTQSKTEAFDLFLSSDMRRDIIRFTNKHGSNDPKWYNIDELEFDAFMGLLILFGVTKGNHENVRDAWSDGPLARPIFKATMSINRFESILRHIRFDESDTRQSRRQTDKFAPFRDMWQKFTQNCKSHFDPGVNLCIDEQLIPFRGRCSFRQYLPSKPDKYGLKIFLLVDCDTGYMYDGIPYTGAAQDSTRTCGLASKITKDLLCNLYNTGRNVTADNYFTDFDLAAELLRKRLTYVGTVRKNKRDLPVEFQADKDRPVGSSCFGFDQNTTIVSYVPKRNKSVILMSTMHHDDKVDETTGKPDIILFYNHTKGAVDTVDQLCHSYSVQRKTRRWPLAYFFNMLNLVGINAFIVFVKSLPLWNASSLSRRKKFLTELGMELTGPYVERRKQTLTGVQRPIQHAMAVCANAEEHAGPTDEVGLPTTSLKSSRKRCHRCARDRKASRTCHRCNRTVCAEHSLKREEITCTEDCAI